MCCRVVGVFFFFLKLLKDVYNHVILYTTHIQQHTCTQKQHLAVHPCLMCHRGKRVAVDVAFALEYLHYTANVVHADIKSNNVLLTANGRAKLAGTGVS